MVRMTCTTLLAVLLLAAFPAQASSPNEIVEEAVDLLTEGLNSRRDELAADEPVLHDFIDGILLPRFDREFAAGAVLGKHWRNASDGQKQRFIKAFYATLVQRYAEGILEFEMDRVEILPYTGESPP